MKKRTVWVAALMSMALSGMAQQVLPQDTAGDKEYARVCREYELKAGNSIEVSMTPMEPCWNALVTAMTAPKSIWGFMEGIVM